MYGADNKKLEDYKHKKLKIEDILESVNILNLYSDEENGEDEKYIYSIGGDASKGYEADLASRKEFEILLSNWTKLALQIVETKTYPWKDASNIKYPLLATAAMQFAARAYPSLVPSSGKVVNCKVLGYDPDGEKQNRAARVSKYMSWQVLDEMEEWEEEMDRLLITLPIAGTVFKKTYWDSEKERNVSCVVMPKDLVVNYWAKDLDSAERITEVFQLNKRKLEERIRAGLYIEDDKLGDPEIDLVSNKTSDPYANIQPPTDDTTPYIICEQHAFLDLDQDGYAEPYVITFEKNSKCVLRIVARFSKEDVKMDEYGKIIRIVPQQFYTKYGFVPNPDGGFYDIGFGRLLGPINEACDSLINQIVDAGSMSNMQAGFIAKGLRMKMGEAAFRPGEWRVVNATGQDLKAGIMPLPLKEPSKVLMELLHFLLQSGKELASVAEIFVGKMPGQNTPATTTMASIEQGMKVFTAVYKRVYRAMTKEFRKLYSLNKMYLNPQTEVEFMGIPMEQSDFQGSTNQIEPAADPASISQQEKQEKVKAMMQLMPMGVIAPMEFAKYYLDAYEIPSPERFLMEPQPKVDPQAEKIQMEAQIAQQESQGRMQELGAKVQAAGALGQQKVQTQRDMGNLKVQHEAILGNLKVKHASEGHAVAAQGATMRNQVAARGSAMKTSIDTQGALVKQAVDQNSQQLRVGNQQELHAQKMRHADQIAKKVKPKGK